MTEIDTMSLDQGIKPYLKAVLGRKAMQIVILDVRNLTSVADAFIICSGRSNRQVTAIADFVQRDLKKKGKKPALLMHLPFSFLSPVLKEPSLSKMPGNPTAFSNFRLRSS